MSKISIKALNNMADNSKELKDQIVYRGFIDENADPDIEYDFSEETLVMLTPIGKFVGSSPDGKPTEEIIDEESVKKMAMQTEEVLLDKDHASMRPQGVRDTSAYGWVSGFKAILGLNDLDGLYAKIRWTTEGLKLVKDRIYRFLSPVFELDSTGKAVRLVNVALTNRPALPLPPIFNGEAKAEENISITQEKKDTDLMNKEEIEKMVSDMISKALEAKADEPKNEEVKEETKEEVKKEEIVEEQPKEEAKNEDVHVDIIEQKKDDETATSQNEEVKEEVKKEEEKEVIKKETLNSISSNASTVDSEPWRNLHGKDFFSYLAKHPEISK